MSRTDKTRPWWVQVVDAPGSTCVPVHDHRWTPCTLPRDTTPVRPQPGARHGVCHWSGTAAFNMRRRESHGYREWFHFRRQDRRRARHEARHALLRFDEH
ncbi:hypothetical protein Dvina_38815 [Dactylosporangium vinaceum]|uniref:Uncharacterized protein n=1 Tax=Dactylosporangium vinaceum TaxID=53362 RepID=A0ABV5MLB6_9ACTN|nr:hypothetical protein [Dactylosporangium vinaceum]UAB94096.1 hypothetical protein Dvina_38815 [Dactylosporangium vinaceum]